jgi:hypothetical protein
MANRIRWVYRADFIVGSMYDGATAGEQEAFIYPVNRGIVSFEEVHAKDDLIRGLNDTKAYVLRMFVDRKSGNNIVANHSRDERPVVYCIYRYGCILKGERKGMTSGEVK